MFPVSRRSMVSNSSIIFLTITALLFESASCQYSNCSGDGQFEPRSEYDTNLYYLLANLTLKSVSETFYNFTTGENPNQVYGLFHCFYGIDNQLCQRSFQTAKNKLLQDCPSTIEAVVWHRKCLLRYANHPIVSINDVSRYHLVNTGPAEYGEYNQQRLNKIISAVDEATSGCSSLSSAARVSQVEENLHLQLEVECTRDLSKSDCRSCLQTAMNRYDKEGHKSALLLQPSCVIFSVFLVRTSPPSTATATPDKKIYISMGVTSGIAAIALIVNIILISCIKRNKATRAPAGLGEIESMDNLQLELDAIKTATSNFSEENKLGQGGFGIVYMGTLKDGQAVAVKRLSNTSRQGIREFKTEACLAAKLQHKNLAKVYGFCMEKEEMLLVYEFVPNKSLNRLLFDAEGVSLNWETRYKIIVGIARGLLYLHEHSSPKIIHRDLKPSNILLDSEMNPKIADFGMAKLFRGDQSQGNTSRIAGTFGYMAPEYVISGHISIKSDVFSYGVILLEIVSGLSIRCLDPDDQEDNLLVYTWKLWNEGNHLKLVDTTLGHNFSKYEVERCIQVGLLCTQEDPAIRPDIASVLIMFNSEVNTKMPLPSCPPDLPYKQETTPISQGSIGIPIEDIITELSPR